MNDIQPKKRRLNADVVEEVDNDNSSSILNHGPIKEGKTIERGPMTMPFSVANASLLEAVKVGNSVNSMPTTSTAC